MRLRNRLVKSDLWLSTDIIAAVEEPLGLMLYQGMWQLADDSGCLPNDALQWKAMLFGAFDGVTASQLRIFADRLIEIGKLVQYEVDGKPYLWLKNFHAHQSLEYPGEPEYPLPEWIEWQTGESRGKARFVIATSICPVTVKSQARRGFEVVESFELPEDADASPGIVTDMSLTQQSSGSGFPSTSYLGSSSEEGESEGEPPLDASTSEREQLHLLKTCVSKDGHRYPMDYAKDLDTLRTLATDYPRVDLTDEIKGLREWLKDHPVGAKSNWRSRLRNWVKKADEFQRKRAPAREPPVAAPAQHYL